MSFKNIIVYYYMFDFMAVFPQKIYYVLYETNCKKMFCINKDQIKKFLSVS